MVRYCPCVGTERCAQEVHKNKLEMCGINHDIFPPKQWLNIVPVSLWIFAWGPFSLMSCFSCYLKKHKKPPKKTTHPFCFQIDVITQKYITLCIFFMKCMLSVLFLKLWLHELRWQSHICVQQQKIKKTLKGSYEMWVVKATQKEIRKFKYKLSAQM